MINTCISTNIQYQHFSNIAICLFSPSVFFLSQAPAKPPAMDPHGNAAVHAAVL